MDIISALILGIIQGLTEFLPISSSGHLILGRVFFGLGSDGLIGSGAQDLAFDAVLHLATVLAIGIYFWRDIRALARTAFSFLIGKTVETEQKHLLGAIILGTIPAIIFGLLLEEYMESIFRNPLLVSVTLAAGALLFFVAEKVATQRANITTKKGIGIGLFQCLALIPGMSRSGSTISGGLILGLKREAAARFSFLLGFPILIGAGAKKVLELSTTELAPGMASALFAGFTSAFFVGLCAIYFLMKYLKKHTLNIFILYRLILAIIVFGIVLSDPYILGSA